MTKSWRPEGWDSTLLQAIKKIPDPKLLEGSLPQALFLFAEAGADAMLEAIKRQPIPEDREIC